MNPLMNSVGSNAEGKLNCINAVVITQTRFGRTPISSAAALPCSVRSDPQQKSAVLGRIPRRRFFIFLKRSKTSQQGYFGICLSTECYRFRLFMI